MKQIFILLISLVIHTSLFAGNETQADFYIAKNGSDNWSGTLNKPNKQKTDGPFASLEKARDAVRELKKTHTKDILVLIRDGLYQFDQTVVFSLQDSGKKNLKITYAAYPEEKPILSAGKEISGFKKVSQVIPGLPKEAQGKVWVADVSRKFLSLYDDQGLLSRARSEGFIPMKGSGRNRLRVPDSKLKKWSNLKDAEVFIRPHHAWIVNILPIVSVNQKKQEVATSVDATYAMNELHFELKGRESCWIVNVIEELKGPGQWVLNTQERKLYLWPRDGKEPKNIVAPHISELIKIEGEIDKKGPKDIPVRNLTFRGITFMHGQRYQLTKEDAGLQHDWDMLDKDNALLRLRGTEDCVIEKCHFLYSGSGAIRVDLHGQRNKISNNHIEHMGGGGILLCGYGPGTKDVNRNNLIFNNNIHHIGEIYWHSPGIFIWQSGENKVTNNLIHHTNYTAIIISGCMTDFFARRGGRELARTLRRHEIGKLPKRPTINDVRPFLHTHDNAIEYNEIHHAMEKLADGNAIYIRGAGARNKIHHNFIHHLVAPTMMQCAIRTDGGQMDTIISENLIWKCTSQGIMLKLNTRCENNIVADIISPPRGYYISLREGPMTGATILNNILYSSNKKVDFINVLFPNSKKTEDRRGRGIAKLKDVNADHNIYFCKSDIDLSQKTLKEHQADNVDKHSQVTDPLFVDPDNGDFSFKPDSPALKMGIKPIDRSKIGLIKETN
ncbi:MAG: right-handed parallel beta-helix repeat-containing protein [Lentisphaeraceae bacterium]|nr:right-handed parallel beta-helix repeat-containing protein [Lentisphaeraceae bacterium]